MGRRHHRFLKSEQLESRRPLAADLAALDINDDMSVTALDALLIINTINQRTATTNTVSAAEAEAELDCDTNSDGVVTPIDVLNVVNQINSGIIAVPTDSTDTTTGADDSETDSSDTTLVDSDPGDDTTSPDDNSSDDNSSDDTSTDDSDSDSSDTSDPVDETDDTDTDDDVVSDPTDETDDDSTDDSTDDDTSDDTNDDDTSTEDPPCEHDHNASETVRRLLSVRHHGRGSLFAALDANGDGALSSDEVPALIWDKLVDADTDSSDTVTQAELKAYREAQRVAAVEAFFEQLDKDDSGAITSADVSRLVWRFLSRADANNDGGVTVDELLALPLPGRWGAH